MNAATGKTGNPFGTSRVDHPFQRHSDLPTIYQDEFNTLKSILDDIKGDNNFQSRGAVVIGAPGAGKTHLMMRLAKEILVSNRLLFIRQPNNPESVLYHIYSRILESLIEKVPGSPYSQIEYLLAKSFSKIIISILQKKSSPTKTDKYILDLLTSSHMNIYKKFGAEGSEKKRQNWKNLENKTIDWWSETYGFSGYAPSIVRGLIKFCSYSDLRKRRLVRKWLSADQLEKEELNAIGLENWEENLSKEDFSLEAVSVFGKLSIEDEPLVIVFDQLEGLKYDEALLLNFGRCIKEIFTQIPNSLIIFNLFPDRWEDWRKIYDPAVTDRISQYKIFLNPPGQEQLKALLNLRAGEYNSDLNTLFSEKEINAILDHDSIRGVLNAASDYYRHKTDGIPLPERSRSFQEKVLDELASLKKEIDFLKAYLNIKPKTLDDIKDNEQVSTYIKHQLPRIRQMYAKEKILTSSDDIGKLKIILDAFASQTDITLNKLKLKQRKLPDHILIKSREKSFVIGFLEESGTAFTSRIKNFNDLAAKTPKINFILFRDQRKPVVKSKIAANEIERLKKTSNGEFRIMDKQERIRFEAIYKLIIDIRNRDFEMDLDSALNAVTSTFSNYWLTDILAIS